MHTKKFHISFITCTLTAGGMFGVWCMLMARDTFRKILMIDTLIFYSWVKKKKRCMRLLVIGPMGPIHTLELRVHISTNNCEIRTIKLEYYSLLNILSKSK